MFARIYRIVLMLQGVYCIITGIWPVLHIVSFMQVTGYKTDQWLVKMVGLLATSLGIGMISAFKRKVYDQSMVIIALFSAAVFMSVDIYYSVTGVISAIYLADALPQLIFILFHFMQLKTGGSRNDKQS